MKRCHGCGGIYKSDIEAINCENRQSHSTIYRRSYNEQVLTDAGVDIINNMTCEYIKTVPNDDIMVELLREGISLWQADDRDGVILLYRKVNKEFTVEEREVFKYTYFSDGKERTCLSDVMIQISIDEAIKFEEGEVS